MQSSLKTYSVYTLKNNRNFMNSVRDSESACRSAEPTLHPMWNPGRRKSPLFLGLE